jgi:hypothetical protein
LTFAQGGFDVPLGAFSARWRVSGKREWHTDLATPSETSGAIYVPAFGRTVEELEVEIDGRSVSAGSVEGGYIRIEGLKGGNYSVEVKRFKNLVV